MHVLKWLFFALVFGCSTIFGALCGGISIFYYASPLPGGISVGQAWEQLMRDVFPFGFSLAILLAPVFAIARGLNFLSAPEKRTLWWADAMCSAACWLTFPVSAFASGLISDQVRF